MELRMKRRAPTRRSPPLRLRYFTSSSSLSSCCFRCRRAAFLIARRCATTASFSIWRSRRVRGSAACGKCFIFGRSAPTFRSFGFAYGSIKLCLPLGLSITSGVQRPHFALRGHVGVRHSDGLVPWRAFQSCPAVAGSPHSKVDCASEENWGTIIP